MNRNKFFIIGFSILTFFIVLFVFLKIMGPMQFTVNNINTLNSTPFEVSGTGKVSAKPDTAVINLGITENGATVAEVQTKVNQTAEKIINSLKEAGVEEKNIKTTNYSINPNYSDLRVGENITGYSVTQNFEVKAPIEKANTIIDLTTANGANLVGGISFTLNDEKMEELKNEARKVAVKNAKASAEGLASAAGINLGEIINVQESLGSVQPFPMMRQAVALDTAVGETPPTNITPGETNIEVTVILTYQTN